MIVPPGYRFLPSDEQLIGGYLLGRVMELPLPCDVILERNLYGENTAPCDVFGDIDESNSCSWHSEDREIKGVNKKTIYVFTKLVRAGPKSSRIARRAGCGTWSGQTGARTIKNVNGEIIGSRKMFTFQDSNPKKGDYHWIMHEYSLDGIYKNLGSNNVNNDVVLCKITRCFKGNPASMENNGGVHKIPQPVETIENNGDGGCFSSSWTHGGIDQIPQLITFENNEASPSSGHKRTSDEGVILEDCDGQINPKKPRNYEYNYDDLLGNQGQLADSGTINTNDDLFEGLEGIENWICFPDQTSTVV